MKKIAILLFSFIMQTGFAQVFDCQKPNSELTEASSFEQINRVYQAYLQSHISLFVEDSLTEGIKQDIHDLGNCYLKRVKNTKGFADYEVAEEFQTQMPGLIFMVLVSKSIDKPEDKQGWFSLLPLMNDDQIEQLYDILYRENRKLGQIATKYKPKSEVSNISSEKMGDYFVAIYQTTGSENTCGVGFEQAGKFYLATDVRLNNPYTRIVQVNLGNLKDVLDKYPNIKDNIKARFDEFRPQYEQFLLNLEPKDINKIKQKEYAKAFCTALIREWIEQNDHFTEVEKLLNLNFNTIKTEAKQRYYYKLYSSWEGKELDAMLAKKKMVEQNTEYDYVDLMFDAFYITVYDQEPACKDSLPLYSKAVLNLYEPKKDELVEDNKSSLSELQTHLMVWDFVKHFNNGQDFKTMATRFLPIYDDLAKDKDNFSKEGNLQTWYFGLTDFYKSGKFKNIKDMNALSQAFNQLYQSTRGVNDNQKQDTQGEFYVYYCLWQLIYNPQFSTENITSVLGSTKAIYENPNLKSYRYIEKDIAKVLLKRVQSPENLKTAIRNNPDTKPPVISGLNIPREEVNTTMIDLLEFNITDRSDMSSIRVYLNGKEHSNFDTEENGDASTKLSVHYVALKIGKNILEIEASDKHGNKTKRAFEIIRADKPIKNAKFYALIIGIDKYSHTRTRWDNLETCVSDCRALASILKNNYQFTKIDTLYNEQATRANIIKKLIGMKAMADLDSNSNILVYYSGHGIEENGTGYWVPFDIDEDNTNYFHVGEVKTRLKTVLEQNKAKHCFVMVDACYSGSIHNSKAVTNVVEIKEEEQANTVYTNGVSFQGFSSGGLTPVPSQSSICGGKSSTFGCALLKTLRDNKSKYFSVSNLSFLVKQKMADDEGAKGQTPAFGPLDNSTARGTEFLFIRK